MPKNRNRHRLPHLHLGKLGGGRGGMKHQGGTPLKADDRPERMHGVMDSVLKALIVGAVNYFGSEYVIGKGKLRIPLAQNEFVDVKTFMGGVGAGASISSDFVSWAMIGPHGLHLRALEPSVPLLMGGGLTALAAQMGSGNKFLYTGPQDPKSILRPIGLGAGSQFIGDAGYMYLVRSKLLP